MTRGKPSGPLCACRARRLGRAVKMHPRAPSKKAHGSVRIGRYSSRERPLKYRPARPTNAKSMAKPSRPSATNPTITMAARLAHRRILTKPRAIARRQKPTGTVNTGLKTRPATTTRPNRGTRGSITSSTIGRRIGVLEDTALE